MYTVSSHVSGFVMSALTFLPQMTSIMTSRNRKQRFWASCATGYLEVPHIAPRYGSVRALPHYIIDNLHAVLEIILVLICAGK
jgi:hypothetical protein